MRAAEGCRDAALMFKTPFISGKDSLNNEFRTEDGELIVVPPTLLISAIGVITDVRKTCTMDLKKPGSAIYVVGDTHDECGGSHWYRMKGRLGANVPHVDDGAPATLGAIAHLIRSGWVRAAHDPSEGGLAVALAEMAFASPYGIAADLTGVPGTTRAADRILFSETPTRLVLEVAPETRARLERYLDQRRRALRPDRHRDGRAVARRPRPRPPGPEPSPRGSDPPRDGQAAHGVAASPSAGNRPPAHTTEERQPMSPRATATGGNRRGTKRAPQKSARTTPAKPRIVVLRAPGTNCDRETAHAFEAAGATTQTLHIGALLAKPRSLARADGLVIPGGFSFGDDLGAGTVLATTLRTHLGDPLRRLVDKGGIVMGICNGFQVLVKTGLLPGFTMAEIEGGLPGIGDDETRIVSLASNLQNRYEDRWVTLECVSKKSVFFAEGDRITCPVAHAEGRFLPRDARVLAALEARGQVTLRYVAPDGRRPAPFPHNPNGSEADIAGISDPTGRVLGLMPHPERNQFVWQDPRFHRGEAPKRAEGLLPFRNAVRYLKRRK